MTIRERMPFYTLILILLVLPACSPPAAKYPLSFDKKGTPWLNQSEKALTDGIGEPLSTEVPETRKAAKILNYAGNTRWQVEQGRAVAHFREPLEHEKSLQYWRHRWKGLEKSTLQEDSTSDHVEGDLQFSAPELGMIVIYRPSVDSVVRVVEYATE